MKRALIVLSVVLALGLVACAKPPKAEMDAAQAAVTSASQNSDIVEWAPEALGRAKALVDQMNAEATARRYDKAKALAADAVRAAENAKTEAEANKEKAKTEATALIEADKKALPEAEKLLAGVVKVKHTTIDLVAKKADVAAAKAAIADAEAALASGDYKKALDRASFAQKTLADVSAAISAAVQSATRKK